jgi:hypothetical protein
VSDDGLENMPANGVVKLLYLPPTSWTEVPGRFYVTLALGATARHRFLLAICQALALSPVYLSKQAIRFYYKSSLVAPGRDAVGIDRALSWALRSCAQFHRASAHLHHILCMSLWIIFGVHYASVKTDAQVDSVTHGCSYQNQSAKSGLPVEAHCISYCVGTQAAQGTNISEAPPPGCGRASPISISVPWQHCMQVIEHHSNFGRVRRLTSHPYFGPISLRVTTRKSNQLQLSAQSFNDVTRC